MRSRYYRNGILSDVYAKSQAMLVHGWKMFGDKGRWFMTDIQIQTVTSEALHFMVDGTRYDISGR